MTEDPDHEMTPHDAGFDLMLPFDVDGLSEAEERQFVRGFEAGTVYAHLRDCQKMDHEFCLDEGGTHTFTVHSRNAEMLLRIGEATGHTVKAEPHDDGEWLKAEFEYDHAAGGPDDEHA